MCVSASHLEQRRKGKLHAGLDVLDKASRADACGKDPQRVCQRPGKQSVSTATAPEQRRRVCVPRATGCDPTRTDGLAEDGHVLVLPDGEQLLHVFHRCLQVRRKGRLCGQCNGADARNGHCNAGSMSGACQPVNQGLHTQDGPTARTFVEALSELCHLVQPLHQDGQVLHNLLLHLLDKPLKGETGAFAYVRGCVVEALQKQRQDILVVLHNVRLAVLGQLAQQQTSCPADSCCPVCHAAVHHLQAREQGTASDGDADRIQT